jgi:hypothetical protein
MEKNQTTVFITTVLSGTTSGTFSENLYLPFTPKTVCVSNVNYANDGATEEGFFSVTTSLIKSLDNILFMARDESSGFYNSAPMTFPSVRNVSGTVEFSYNSIVTRSGFLTFALTFRD